VLLKQLFVGPFTGQPVSALVAIYADHFTVTWTADAAIVKDINLLNRLLQAELSKTD